MLRETTVVLRKVNRKSWIGIGVLPLAVVLALTAPTYAQSDEKHDEGGCSDATLSGDYAFTIGGEILAVPASATPPSPGVALAQAGVAMMHFDGTGDFTQGGLHRNQRRTIPRRDERERFSEWADGKLHREFGLHRQRGD